jgi:opacity protein-like surface antigen
MKIRANISGLSVVLVGALGLGWSAAAADFDSDTVAGGDLSGFYESGDAGVAIMQPLVLQGSVDGMNVGPRLDVSLGYNVTKNFAMELQGGFAHNVMSSQDGRLFPSGFSVGFWTVPVTANGIYRLKLNDHWQAYGGLGAGVVISTVEDNYFGDNLSSTDCEFGYQAQAGIKYLINDQLECGLGYNFLGTLDHHWTLFGPFSTSPTYMHAILLNLTYRF